MDTLHRPIVHPRSAERAAVAAAVVQDAPRVAQLVAIFPDCFDNVLVGVGVLLVQAVGDQADPFPRVVAAKSVSIGFVGHDSGLRAWKIRGSGLSSVTTY